MAEPAFYRLTALGRPIDPKYPTNRAALVGGAVALVAGAVWGWVDEGTFAAAGLLAVAAAVTVVGAWALGRELDPDGPHTAFIAIAFALVPLFLFGDSDLWTLLPAIGLARVVNRSVGPPAKLLDLVGVTAVIGVAVLLAERWSLGVVATLAFIFDAALPGGRRDRYVFAALTAATVGVAWVLHGGLPLSLPRHGFGLGALIIAVALTIATLPPLESVTDVPGHDLHYRRVQGGVAIVLLLVLIAQFEPASTLPASGAIGCLVATVAGRITRRAPAPD
jgi:hypothetical protein